MHLLAASVSVPPQPWNRTSSPPLDAALLGEMRERYRSRFRRSYRNPWLSLVGSIEMQIRTCVYQSSRSDMYMCDGFKEIISPAIWWISSGDGVSRLAHSHLASLSSRRTTVSSRSRARGVDDALSIPAPPPPEWQESVQRPRSEAAIAGFVHGWQFVG